MAAVALVLVAAAGGVWMAVSPGGSAGGERRVAAPTTVQAEVHPDTAEVLPSSSTTLPLPPRAGCPPVDEPLAADVDSDGCADAVRFRDGVVEAAGSRWAVGQAGDLVAVGDWSCVGAPSLAVLRPGTGDVFAFATWATSGQDVSGPRVATVVGGTTLRAADLDGDGCHELVVERATGAPAVLRIPAPRR